MGSRKTLRDFVERLDEVVARVERLMPTPVSRTQKRSFSIPVLPSSTRSTPTTTSPSSVNFTALLRKFISSWRMRAESPRWQRATRGST